MNDALTLLEEVLSMFEDHDFESDWITRNRFREICSQAADLREGVTRNSCAGLTS